MLTRAYGWMARFKYGEGDKERYASYPVLYWQEDEYGSINGLIESLDTDRSGLRNARDYSSFQSFDEDGESDVEIISALPGWWSVWKEETDEAEAWWWRVMFWRVRKDGWGCEAITTPSTDGEVSPSEPKENHRYVYDAGWTKEGPGPWPFGNGHEVS